MSSDSNRSGDTDTLAQELQAALGDRYTLLEPVGSGGSGTVFAAHDTKHDRRVAIKLLSPSLREQVDHDRFLREIHIAAGLNHPHIVPVFDSGRAGGLLFYVMPLMEGESLHNVIRREGRIPLDRALSIIREVADALDCAHAAGVVHRDVKPANILLVGGHALLADFGVAQPGGSPSGILTETGAAVGTPAYMSPEQITGEATIGPASDIFSLACVLLEMLTGSRPSGRSFAVAALTGSEIGSTLLRTHAVDVPAGIASAIDLALSPNPEQRFRSAEDFSSALREPVRGRRWVLSAVAVVATLAMGVVLGRALGPDPPSLADQSGSVVVLPFGDEIQTPDEARLVVDLAGELTRQLNRWDSVRAVPQVSLAGVKFDLGIPDAVLTRLDQGVETAQALGVESLVVLRVRLRGEQAVVSASRFDARRGRELGRMLESTGPADDPYRLAAQIAHDLLGLEGSVDEVEELRRQSSSPQALRLVSDGLDLLGSWRLAEAEAAFRAAVEADSTYAMAYHHLALTQYWQGAREVTGLRVRGPEAGRLSRAALRHGEALPPRERTHVTALNGFLEGDYEAARGGYDQLLRRDSTDVYAWLLRGIVEFRDPWLVEMPDGERRPRADLNLAARAFTETTRLSPGFHLGYGHLFDITEKVLGGDGGGVLTGFLRPGNERIPPWEPLMDPSSMESYALVRGDSLRWISNEAFQAEAAERRRVGAIEMLAASIRTLSRWAAYAPDEARPHEELARWTVRQRSLLRRPESPARLDSLAAAARRHLMRSLALRPDTLSSDLVLLGNLELASGDPARARALVERAVDLAMAEERPLERSATNPFLYQGDWRGALALLDHERAPASMFVQDSAGALRGDGGVAPLIRRLQILGSTGVTGSEVEQLFTEVEDVWRRPDENVAPAARLMAIYASRVSTALAGSPDVLARWRGAATLDDPLWEAVDPSQEDRRETLAVALRDDGLDGRPAGDVYLLGKASLDVGEPALAHRVLSRLDSLAFAVDRRDVGWGLQALSHYHRGQALEQLGDTIGATSAYRRFLDARGRSGGSLPLVPEAQARLRVLEDGGQEPASS